jgi:hypothetical protein
MVLPSTSSGPKSPFKDAPKSGAISVPFAPALPPAPTVQEEPVDLFLDSTRLEQEAGRKAMDTFAAKTNAEQELGRLAVQRRTK